MDTTGYKRKLESERDKLEGELTRLGVRDTNDPSQWELRVPGLDVMEADENEVADRAEEVHIDQIVLDELEARYRLVLHALRKIEQGTYGTCEISGTPIEEDRLAANPAARTAKAYMGQENTLTL